ncbi:uncharacterized protein LOC117191203 [Drosophila miranda]|uniref:uncharacterized protein LOC108158307 n=1 Tax=Drosophila miranda TaxID=7229 RepID=UPI0007E77517|nr:uncharacterized protein LOC108158307 [Drosophila miranda]XP_033252028.1 uncharacterized protein LOC117191203 [Drosophila miranda]
MDTLHELTREDILEQFKRRELHLTNAKELTLDELRVIYKGFIVPLPRREPRDRRPQKPMEIDQLTERIKVVSMVGGKRPIAEEPCCSNQSSHEAKQIKMDLH